MSADHYHVFLSYHRADAAFVREVKARLQSDGLRFWFDEDNLVPGELWQKAIQRDLPCCDSCAVFLGPSGVGPWQELETYAALSQQINAERDFRVIPVLLPGAVPDKAKNIPLFLQHLTCIEFKAAPGCDEEAYHRLLCGIRGEARGFVLPPPRYVAASASQGRILPRGLRSFEAEDHEWFLRLVPGPRGKHGLPSVLRFWKDRLEQIDPDETFKVGLLYGPSGCGKSSLVKAGLIPALAEFVLPIYVEATAQDTEATILRKLGKALPSLPTGQSLSQTLAALRRQPELAGGRKVVLLLDQFEQWLHAHRADMRGELTEGLRHCDGGRLQAVLMVRDEFVHSVHRFLESLAVPIIEGKNFAKADLFDLDHARAVLIEYGRAFGKLPDPPGLPEVRQQQFLARVLDALKTDDGKVACAHLALLAELMKATEWTPEGLRDRGGAKRVGLHFFKETFEGRSANPDHQTRRGQARAVLKQLLSTTEQNIRGPSQPARALAAAAGLADQPAGFARLVQILNEELKLITPTEAADETPAAVTSDNEARYQLTHDYLVPALREWLAQALTARERAALDLERRTAQWRLTPGVRFLPNPLEYLRILCLAPRAGRSAGQKALLRAAGRFYAGALAVLAAVALAGFSVWGRSEEAQAKARVEVLLAAPPEAVPYAAKNLLPFRQRAVRLLRTEFSRAANDSKTKLHAALGLAAFGDVRVKFLLDSAAWAPSSDWISVTRALASEKASVLSETPQAIAKTEAPEGRARLATLALLWGDSTPLQRLTLRDSNPTNRTAFIHGYPQWPGDPLRLAEILQSASTNGALADFRSVLCAALALVEWGAFTAPEQAALAQTMRQLYTEAPDGGTHGAAACALTRWGQPLPEVAAPTHSPPGDCGWFINRQGMTMLRIPAGSFRMGAPGDYTEHNTPHSVTISKAFFISDREVTVALFRQFTNHVAQNPDTPPLERLRDWGGEESNRSPTTNCPVQQVSWFDAVKFCNWLSRREHRTPCYRASSSTNWECNLELNGYRLPTEAEWEYACRAVSESQFTFGDDEKLLGEYACYVANSPIRTWPAGSKLPNLWGVFDMHGNVWEWCQDWYAEDYYQGSPKADPPGPASGSVRVLRGGSWYNSAGGAHCAGRGWYLPDSRGRLNGFRVVASPFFALKSEPSEL